MTAMARSADPSVVSLMWGIRPPPVATSSILLGRPPAERQSDHERVFDALDRARAKFPDMVLLHGGSLKGAERIAACWAESRKVTQITFKPNWTKHAKAAPFRRNDDMLSIMPAGLIIFSGSGITDA